MRLHPASPMRPLAQAGALALLLLVISLTAQYKYLLFHTLVEIVRIVAMCGIAIVAWNGRQWIDSAFLKVYGFGLPGIAVLALLHTLAYQGTGIFNDDANLPTQLWIAQRFVECLLMLLGAALPTRSTVDGRWILPLNLASALAGFCVFAGWFPDCFVEGQGLTTFKVVSESLIVALAGVAVLLLLRQRNTMERSIQRLALLSLGVGMAAELAFTRYVAVYGASNMVGHLLMLVSSCFLYYALVLQGIRRPQLILFHKLQQERDLVRQRLGESEDMLRLIRAVTPDAEVVLDAQSRVVSWNQAAQHMFGRTSADALGQDGITLLVPEHLQQSARIGLKRLMSGERKAAFQNRELAACRRDGSQFPVEVSLSTVQIGGLPHAVLVMRDISEQKAAQRSLQQANRRLRLLSASNQSLLHATSLDELLERMCHTLTAIGGFEGVWIGRFNPAEPGAVVTVHGCKAARKLGLDAGRALELDTGSVLACALANGRSMLCEDDVLLPGADWKTWGAAALATGKDGLVNCVLLWTSVRELAHAEDLSTYQELAADLTFGIDTLRMKNAREHDLQEVAQAMEETVLAIAGTVEMRDPYTAGHQRRVAELAEALGRELGLDAGRIHGVRLAALIHDIGKLSIPSEILVRPGRLSPLEYSFIKTHCRSGYEIVKNVRFPWPIALAILQHHERLDGSGYPDGLKGDAICLEARIIAVADLVEAMSSHRPYRAGRGIEAALAELQAGRGTTFDPAVVDACLRLFKTQGFRFSDTWGAGKQAQGTAQDEGRATRAA